ncbi:D-glycerate dehydrogenase [Alkalibacter sp. M17DMB]|nr:D-glycerate dehydrogenase [Alkalibacter mobilis]MBF7096633.1 D-glycerate dehydrogenase [Alkalibacter mobilis]
MRKKKVFIAKKIPKEVEEYISDHCDYEIWDRDEQIPMDLFYKKIADKDGVLLTKIPVDQTFFQHGKNLKVVSNISAGYDNFDVDEIRNRKIIATHTPKVLDETVADLIMGLMLATARRIPELDAYVRNNKWKPTDVESLFGVDVSHAVLGIIGMGNIGEAVAKRARMGFDMEVLYHNRNRKIKAEESLGVKYADMDDLLAKSDYVVIMTPSNESTYRMFNKEMFKKMKRTAIFINASRGEVVDENDLVEALKTGTILGAGLDVYDKEPIPKENPLLEMKNVVLLPHIGSATHKTRFDMAMCAAKDTVSALSGHLPENLIPELKI